MNATTTATPPTASFADRIAGLRASLLTSKAAVDAAKRDLVSGGDVARKRFTDATRRHDLERAELEALEDAERETEAQRNAERRGVLETELADLLSEANAAADHYKPVIDRVRAGVLDLVEALRQKAALDHRFDRQGTRAMEISMALGRSPHVVFRVTSAASSRIVAEAVRAILVAEEESLASLVRGRSLRQLREEATTEYAVVSRWSIRDALAALLGLA